MITLSGMETGLTALLILLVIVLILIASCIKIVPQAQAFG